MSKKIFEGYTIFSDVDGTLVNNKKEVPQRNLDAIKYFIDNGGNFTISSGRPYQRVEKLYNKSNANISAICSNGNLIYDFINKKILKQYFLDDNIKKEIFDFVKIFPDAILGIYADDLYQIFYYKDKNDWKIFVDEFTSFDTNDSIIKSNWLKCNIIAEPYDIPKIKEYFENKPYFNDYNFTQGEAFLFEICNKLGTKGSGIKFICDYYNLDINKTIAVGDYENDIAMLKTAKYSFTPKNGKDKVKNIVDYVTISDNNEGCFFDIIQILEKEIIK